MNTTLYTSPIASTTNTPQSVCSSRKQNVLRTMCEKYLIGTHATIITAFMLAIIMQANNMLWGSDNKEDHSYTDVAELQKEIDGYQGIWYANSKQEGKYVYKYSGGLGTYCAKHRPFAVYSQQADKTFFCYGGTTESNKKNLVHMVSYYDHKTGMVPRPRVLVNKKTEDAHDNPVISLDGDGRIWVFSSSHGTRRPSFISVSKKPYDISEFEQVHTKAFASPRFEANYSYPQLHYIPGEGFVFLLTRYKCEHRFLYSSNSPHGHIWTSPRPYATIEMGHYQISERFGKKIGTCFNYHPETKSLDWRTNLYYIETCDMGNTWKTVDGKPLILPLTSTKNPALIYDAKKKNVYLKDITFDAQGNPIVLFITSGGWQAGPENGPRVWHTARWTGCEWDIKNAFESDNNYDMGSLYIESNGDWRIIAPTETGPQPFNPGGEVAIWLSKDQGNSWTKIKQLTANSKYNHTYCRRPLNAHPDFYAFWADGHARKRSPSHLYFTNREGSHVWRLPVKMEGPFARPEIVW